jgi:hypothetical protein
MRRSVRIAALTASLATVLSGGLMATVASAGTASASTGSVHVINLHDARKTALSRGITIHAKAITLPRGVHRASRTAAAGSCAEPNCDLVYGGGLVQHSPEVYLLLWGPGWGSGGQLDASVYLKQFYQGLGEQQDNWSKIMTQYPDSAGPPVFSGSVLAGTYFDTSVPPAGATQADLAAESDAFDVAGSAGGAGGDRHPVGHQPRRVRQQLLRVAHLG